MLFADVIVDISVKSLDRPFQYRIPEKLEEEAVVGAMVEIPFGKGNRAMKGYIIERSTVPNYDVAKIKSITAVVKQGVVAESHLLSLAYWMKRQYGGTMNDAIKAVMPIRREIKEKEHRQVFPAMEQEEMHQLREELQQKHQMARVRVVDALLSAVPFSGGMEYGTLCSKCKVTAQVLRAMEQKNILTIDAKRQYRNPYEDHNDEDKIVQLNEEQRQAVDRICGDRQKGIADTYLLYGVTGSGKTEVYMQCIREIVDRGEQVIVLIPEIALTFQTVHRFHARFGDRVSVLHSKLSAGERYDQYTRAKRGEIDIMIGPRSALFTPFEKLGLIVIDEEHEQSYQSETMPKYHAREVARQRASMLGASLLLGSATPSMETYYQVQQGNFHKLTLSKRAGGASLPQVEIVDLREELRQKNYSVFSRSLRKEIEERLARKEQTILFLNRRGYAGFVSCRECGEVVGCPHCAVSLKPHSRRGQVEYLRCHYCGYTVPMPPKCPSCGSKYIGTFGLGTQQVEQMVQKQFPGASVLRMDADTTGGKAGHDKILQKFAERQADILVGTQMIVKGHDFPGVTLVGILAADLSLNVGDYTAAERTYQLLAQAAGRAGRGKTPGKVVLQTYQPEHYSIVCAAEQDYDKFYKHELFMRQMLQYPPVSHILGVLVLSADCEQAKEFAQELAGQMKGDEYLTVLGPAEAAIGKINDIYRYMIYGKCSDYAVLVQVKDKLEAYINDRGMQSKCTVQFAFDPAG